MSVNPSQIIRYTRHAAPAKSPAWLVAVLVVVFAALGAILLSLFKPGDDWAPLWAASQLAATDAVQAYDVATVSALQAPLTGQASDRPFVYPPSALLVFMPFALLPFGLSYGLFTLMSLVLLSAAARLIDARPALLLLAPPVLLAGIAGQPSLLAAALIVYALTQLDRAERRAGLVLGIAAMMKPPLLLLAPLALLAGGYWRALVTAGLTAAAMGAMSWAAFGIEAWQAWFAALPRFNVLVSEFAPLLRNAVTPYAMAVRLGLPPLVATACAVPVAALGVWLAFTRTPDVSIRLVALVGGGLLISPYAMNYELAVLAPAVAAVRLRGIRDLIMPMLWAASLFVNVSLAGLLAAMVWAGLRLFFEQRGKPDPARPAVHSAPIA